MVMRSPALRWVKSLASLNPIPTGCIFYYPAWHDSLRGSVFKSLDIFGHTITWTGSTIDGEGRILDGNDWAIMSDTPFDFERTDAFAIGVRFKTSSAVTSSIFAKQEGSGKYAGYTLEILGAGGITFTLINDVSPFTRTVIGSTGTINDGTVHTVFGQNKALAGGDASDCSVYIDGVEDSNTAFDNLGSNSILNNVNLRLGSRDGGGQAATCTILEAWVYDRALSAEEHNYLHSQVQGRP